MCRAGAPGKIRENGHVSWDFAHHPWERASRKRFFCGDHRALFAAKAHLHSSRLGTFESYFFAVMALDAFLGITADAFAAG